MRDGKRGGRSTVSELVFPKSKQPDSRTVPYLLEALQKDWDQMRAVLDMNEEQARCCSHRTHCGLFVVVVAVVVVVVVVVAVAARRSPPASTWCSGRCAAAAARTTRGPPQTTNTATADAAKCSSSPRPPSRPPVGEGLCALPPHTTNTYNRCCSFAERSSNNAWNETWWDPSSATRKSFGSNIEFYYH